MIGSLSLFEQFGLQGVKFEIRDRVPGEGPCVCFLFFPFFVFLFSRYAGAQHSNAQGIAEPRYAKTNRRLPLAWRRAQQENHV
jgi:hypothetical protein